MFKIFKCKIQHINESYLACKPTANTSNLECVLKLGLQEP